MLHGRVENLGLLLLLAVLVAIVARRLRLPYTVGLTVAGSVLAFLQISSRVQLTGPLIFDVFLPPLIFEAAFHLRWPDLKREMPVVLTLAVAGVVIAAGVTAWAMHAVAGWEWQTALLFGVLIAATDPVAVIALFREAKATGRLPLLVEAESLFNDAIAAVLFVTLLVVGAGGAVTPASVAGTFGWSVAGGIGFGLAVGGLSLLLLGRTDDHLVETAVTTLAAYGAFLLAEQFHASGVLATLAAGILLGNAGPLGAFTEKGHQAVEEVWEFITFLVNSLLFLLLGMRVAQGDFRGALLPIACAIVLSVGARGVAVLLCCLPFAKSSQRVLLAEQGVLIWGGLRGALGLALALGLPASVPGRGLIQTTTFAVVAFSVIVQGLTVGPLLRRVGKSNPPA